MPKKSLVLLVLNFNGVETLYQGRPLLDFCLPSLSAACDRYGRYARVVVIDNSSTDGSVEYIARHYPAVTVFQNPNRFLFSYNDILPSLHDDIVVFCNSDIKLEPDSLDHIAKCFDDPSVFCVGPDICARDSDDGKTRLSGSRCIRLQYYKGRLFPVDIGGVIERDLPQPAYVLGAAAAYDRKKLVELGGLDELYYPFYWEDCDIAFQARDRGWKNLIEERAVAYHLGSHTMDPSHVNNQVQAIHLKNEYLFLWKFLKQPKYIWQSLAYLPYNALHYRFGGVYCFCKAVIGLARALPLVLKRRRRIHNSYDAYFFNDDVEGHVAAYMWAHVYVQSGEYKKALREVLRLRPLALEDAHMRVHLQETIARICVHALDDGTLGKIIDMLETESDAILSAQTVYVLASYFRDRGNMDRARELYGRVMQDARAKKSIMGAACYHSAVIAAQAGVSDEARSLCHTCLSVIPDHGKCRELLESL